MFFLFLQFLRWVHCRTGSLEIFKAYFKTYYIVHCRTGSLESYNPKQLKDKEVHCRTGSLEIVPQDFH